MTKKTIFTAITFVFIISLFFAGCQECAKKEKKCLAGNSMVILDHNNKFNLSNAETASTVKAVIEDDVLKIDTGIEEWASINFVPEDKKWDLSDYEFLAADIKNTSEERVYVRMRIDNVGGDGENYSETAGIDLKPGQ